VGAVARPGMFECCHYTFSSMCEELTFRIPELL
jgi:hypothetical protein